MNLSLLSKYRTELMGFAIINVILFHLGDLNPIKKIWEYGYLGVDIFLLLSGMGLAYSWEKNNNVIEFYKKRFMRIIPAYIITVMIYLLIMYKISKISSIKVVISVITGMNFWRYSDRTFWYIYAIMLLYLIFPIIVKLINKSRTKFYILLIFLYFCCIVISFSKFNYLLIFFTRIPVFILGVYLGNELIEDKNKRIEYKKLIILFILGIVLLYYKEFIYLKRIGIEWIALIFIIYPISLYIGYIIEKIKNNFVKEKLTSQLKILGKYSLEIYLVHIVLFMFDLEIEKLFYFNEILKQIFINTKYITYIFISILLAVVLNKLIAKILNFKIGVE